MLKIFVLPVLNLLLLLLLNGELDAVCAFLSGGCSDGGSCLSGFAELAAYYAAALSIVLFAARAVSAVRTAAFRWFLLLMICLLSDALLCLLLYHYFLIT